MIKKIAAILLIAVLGVSCGDRPNDKQAPIDRQAVVQRHTVKLDQTDTLAALSVGNGHFAITVDITGLQSFPDEYLNGVPLGTQSEWGWHAFPNTEGYKLEEALKTYQLNGRPVSYAVQNNGGPIRARQAADYFRINAHRLHLANIGLEILKKDGSLAGLKDIASPHQELDMWTGRIHSRFTVEGVPVEVTTIGHPQQDAVAVQVRSPLLAEKRIRLRIRLPYPSGDWGDRGNDFQAAGHQSAVIRQSEHAAVISHELDTTRYFISSSWTGAAQLNSPEDHYYLLEPADTASFEATVRFDSKDNNSPVPGFDSTKAAAETAWAGFWNSGAAVDFAGSTDPRATELERRIVLSQYLTRIQCAGHFPPQETGLTYNSWYGKPHLEMHWWHAIHFALWGRPEFLEPTVDWYFKVKPVAREIARRQGYEGLRWQKMTDNDGREVPSSVGAFLIWQQPHPIYYSELLYRARPEPAVLEKYKELVFGTAEFMASFARYDSLTHHYVLGKGLIPAQERFKPETTFNPTYELVYWYWALGVAQQWRERLGMERLPKWDSVMQQISPLPVQDNKYLFTESATDSYTNPEYRTDHPSVLGALGLLPATPLLDKKIMQNSFDWIWKNWSWEDTWGWDFPMTAMTATRLGDPEKAIDALLMPIQTNTYLPSGHNYQEGRLTIYLPGNGGLLTAIAMMCGGYDQANGPLPGIPKNGKWQVKAEGFAKMP